MDKKTKKESLKTLEEFSALDDVSDVASATECTGLMQIPPENSAEAASYADIYNVPQTVNEAKQGRYRHKRATKNRLF